MSVWLHVPGGSAFGRVTTMDKLSLSHETLRTSGMINVLNLSWIMSFHRPCHPGNNTDLNHKRSRLLINLIFDMSASL